MPTEKVSLTLPAELLQAVRELAGGNLSAWVSEALTHAVRAERLRAYVAEREAKAGPLDPELLATAEANFDTVDAAAWPA
jgi:Post-segregation antitoxin CcdA